MISLQTVLIRLVLFSVVPLVLASAGLIYHLVTAQRETLHDDILESARQLSRSIDSQLAVWQVIAQTFAVAAMNDSIDLERAYARATEVVAEHPGVRIALIDPSGQQLFNTARPFGAKLPNVFERPAPRSQGSAIESEPASGIIEVVNTGRPSFSSLFIGSIDSRPALAYRLPIRRGDDVAYVLSIAFHPEDLIERPQRERVAPGSISAIVDRHGIVTARNRAAERFVGQSASEQFLAQTAGKLSGIYRGQSLEGTPVMTAFSRSERSGWLIGTEVPLGEVDQRIQRSLWIWSTLMLFLVCLGVAMARRTWTQVGHPLRVLAANASAFERGEAIAVPHSLVREVRDCGRAWSLAIEADRARREQQSLLLAAELRQREVERVSREKDRVLAALGHELRNPLGAITNSVHVLDNAAPADPRLAAMIAIIKRQCLHLGRLVDNLLDLARATFGKMQIDRRPLDLAHLVRNTLSAYTPRQSLPALHLHIDPVWVEGDATRLDQVVRNLIDNSIKFTPPAGSIDVYVGQQGAEAFLKIADTGTGIPTELAGSLFDAFVQNEQTLDRAQGGLGLGLALVREIVELHGGRVAARSDGPGRGTQITLHLPSCEPVVSPDSQSDANEPSAPRRRVLIVEDQDDARTSLALLLESMGQDVRAVSDAAGAQVLLDEWMPQVALIDLGLPGTDGFELVRSLRANSQFRSLKLIAVTGYTLPADRERARQAGFDAFLPKPVSREALAKSLEGSGS